MEQDALFNLIEEKGFDAATVGHIAERAMVNRTTFYRHEPDKYALVLAFLRKRSTTCLLTLARSRRTWRDHTASES